jgi:large repetitive protein
VPIAPAADWADAPTSADLQAIRQEAIARWAAAGLDTARQDQMAAAAIIVADLGGSQLGQFQGGQIQVDVDAAGHRWFIDSTPATDDEFTSPVQPGVADRMDLLTVVAHELGHAVGLDDVMPPSTDVMTMSLGTGLRRMPTAAGVDAVFAAEQV